MINPSLIPDGSRWRHYAHGLCEVVGIARVVEADLKVVVHRYPDGSLWTCSLNQWFMEITLPECVVNGEKVPRRLVQRFVRED